MSTQKTCRLDRLHRDALRLQTRRTGAETQAKQGFGVVAAVFQREKTMMQEPGQGKTYRSDSCQNAVGDEVVLPGHATTGECSRLCM
jgi:hypothetical protein